MSSGKEFAKSAAEITEMKGIALVIANVLDIILPSKLSVGMSCKDIEEIVEQEFKKNNVTTLKGFVIDGEKVESSVHISMGNEVVHGLPEKSKIITESSTIRVDLVGFRNGMYADAARTLSLGELSEKQKKVTDGVKVALQAVIDNVRVGDYMSKISKTIQSIAVKYGVYIIPVLAGHNIGSELHKYPSVPNLYLQEYFSKNDFIIPNNLVLAIEPVFISDKSNIKDEAGVIVLDNLDACIAHYEDTILFEERSTSPLTRVR